MARNVHHGADQARVVSGVNINFRPREWNILECLLHFLRPLLHKVVYIRHLLCVVYSRRWSCLVQVLYTIDPPRYFLRFLVCMLNRLDIHRGRTHDITLLDVSQLDHCLVLRI